MITLAEILPHFDGNRAALARALGITRQAINAWPVDGPIPERQELRLRYEVLPEVFGPRTAQNADEVAA